MKKLLITLMSVLTSLPAFGSVVAWDGQIIALNSSNEVTYIEFNGIVGGETEVIEITNLDIGQDYYISARVSGGEINKGWLPLTSRISFEAQDQEISLRVRNKHGNIDDWVIDQVALVPHGQDLDRSNILEYDINNPEFKNREMQFYPGGQEMAQGWGDVGWVSPGRVAVPEPGSMFLLLIGSGLLFIRQRN